MAIKLGKNASVKKGENTVARLTSMSVTLNNSNVDVTAFGDDWDNFVNTIRNWSGTFSGQFDLSGDYQNTLHNIALSGGTVDDIRFYEDATYYWAPDTETDSDATAIIESYTWNADQSGVVTFTMNIKGSGPITRTSAS